MCRFAVLLLAILCVSCQTYRTPIADDPIYRLDEVDVTELEDQGERYTRRGEYIVDISEIGPRPDETYGRFRQRLLNTLAMQEYNRDQLTERLDASEKRIGDLSVQLDEMRRQNAEMRLALAQPSDAAAMGARQTRFNYYRVQKGDTLQKIAHELYGTHTAWLALYRFNRSRLSDGPNRIEVGTSLFVPMAETIPR